jgi:hypothetical protein
MKLGRKYIYIRLCRANEKKEKRKKKRKKESYRHVLLRTKWEFKEMDILVIFFSRRPGPHENKGFFFWLLSLKGGGST